MTTNPKFYNKNGELNTYAFGCGYIQTFEHNNGAVMLYKDGCWHVKLYDHEGDRLAWHCYDGLTEARKQYRAFKARIKAGDVVPLKPRGTLY